MNKSFVDDDGQFTIEINYWGGSRLSDGYSIEHGLKLRVNHGNEKAAQVAQELQNFLNQ